jgi:hypothetical protein
VNGDGDGDGDVGRSATGRSLATLFRQVTSGSEEFDGASVDVELLEAQHATVVSAR